MEDNISIVIPIGFLWIIGGCSCIHLLLLTVELVVGTKLYRFKVKRALLKQIKKELGIK